MDSIHVVSKPEQLPHSSRNSQVPDGEDTFSHSVSVGYTTITDPTEDVHEYVFSLLSLAPSGYPALGSNSNPSPGYSTHARKISAEAIQEVIRTQSVLDSASHPKWVPNDVHWNTEMDICPTEGMCGTPGTDLSDKSTREPEAAEQCAEAARTAHFIPVASKWKPDRRIHALMLSPGLRIHCVLYLYSVHAPLSCCSLYVDYSTELCHHSLALVSLCFITGNIFLRLFMIMIMLHHTGFLK